MYFEMRAVTLRATEDYSWESMIGEIGGYASLLLGIAVIDLVQNNSYNTLYFRGQFAFYFHRIGALYL